MKWNMNSKELLAGLDEEDTWNVLRKKRNEIEPRLFEIWDNYNNKAVESAKKYGAINLMLKWTNLVNCFFPESIRCTVHPKENQFALSMNYAWNGVAWADKWPRSIVDIKTKSFYSLSDKTAVYLVRMHSTNYPCFFTSEKKNSIFECAKQVLKSDGWNTDNIFGREFTIYDSSCLYELGKNDREFTWERELKSKEYYSTLLQFRISHYKKYGFGVHAIFRDGVLIGQMGLQVLDEKEGKIEYVIFLGKEYRGKGIGTELLKYLFKRCKEVGITTIYGVIRNSNSVGKKIASKFNGKELTTVTHYNQPGILYEINL